MRELRAVVSGEVQGVGFRWVVQQHARDLGLDGWVRNCPDGTVELCAQGSDAQLQELVRRIQNSSGSARIDHVTPSYQEITQPLVGFSIAR